MAAEARPRPGRIAALALAVAVTLTSVVAGSGLLPTGRPPASYAGTGPAPTVTPTDDGVMSLSGQRLRRADGPPPLPEGSGSGRRVVFDESDQRVWLVRADGSVARSYPVSGSVYDNLDPGTYAVYSRSLDAHGIDGSTMRFMVRFTRGDNAAIGFHSIPRMDGRPMQTRAELGTPLSHGCIRQAGADARAMWRFGRVGTPVVVTT
jgi:hypothetical protein